MPESPLARCPASCMEPLELTAELVTFQIPLQAARQLFLFVHVSLGGPSILLELRWREGLWRSFYSGLWNPLPA